MIVLRNGSCVGERRYDDIDFGEGGSVRFDKRQACEQGVLGNRVHIRTRPKDETRQSAKRVDPTPTTQTERRAWSASGHADLHEIEVGEAAMDPYIPGIDFDIVL